jgi:hypothetical protein
VGGIISSYLACEEGVGQCDSPQQKTVDLTEDRGSYRCNKEVQAPCHVHTSKDTCGREKHYLIDYAYHLVIHPRGSHPCGDAKLCYCSRLDIHVLLLLPHIRRLKDDVFMVNIVYIHVPKPTQGQTGVWESSTGLPLPDTFSFRQHSPTRLALAV